MQRHSVLLGLILALGGPLAAQALAADGIAQALAERSAAVVLESRAEAQDEVEACSGCAVVAMATDHVGMDGITTVSVPWIDPPIPFPAFAIPSPEVARQRRQIPWLPPGAQRWHAWFQVYLF